MEETEMPDRESRVDQEKGIDVSHWQGTIDWNKVAKDGVKHVIIKMSENGSYVDSNFVQNWNSAKEVGIKVNCYHYFSAFGCTTEEQMENIKKSIKTVDFDSDKNILALDVEEIGNEKATPVQMADNLNALINLIKKDPDLSHCTIMIYTSYGYWDTKVKWDKYSFSAYPLWVAHWEAQAPHLPQPWKNAGETWSWWQYSSRGKVNGISGNVDMNWVKV